MAVGAEPSGRIMLKGDMVERAGLVGVCVGGRKVTEGSLFTACSLSAFSAIWGLCFWRELTLDIQKMVFDVLRGDFEKNPN